MSKPLLKLDQTYFDGIYRIFLIADTSQSTNGTSFEEALFKWLNKYGEKNGLRGHCVGVIK